MVNLFLLMKPQKIITTLLIFTFALTSAPEPLYALSPPSGMDELDRGENGKLRQAFGTSYQARLTSNRELPQRYDGNSTMGRWKYERVTFNKREAGSS